MCDADWKVDGTLENEFLDAHVVVRVAMTVTGAWARFSAISDNIFLFYKTCNAAANFLYPMDEFPQDLETCHRRCKFGSSVRHKYVT